MDGETVTWFFLIGGAILMILELILPGGLAFFLGISGVGIGVLRLLGILSDPGISIMSWLFLSVALTATIRPFVKKYFKGETSYKLADEDYEAIGQIVEVTEPVSSENDYGRIRFNGISWQARTIEGEIPAGSKARISYRENTTWIIESADEINQIGNKVSDRST